MSLKVCYFRILIKRVRLQIQSRAVYMGNVKFDSGIQRLFSYGHKYHIFLAVYIINPVACLIFLFCIKKLIAFRFCHFFKSHDALTLCLGAVHKAFIAFAELHAFVNVFRLQLSDMLKLKRKLVSKPLSFRFFLILSHFISPYFYPASLFFKLKHELLAPFYKSCHSLIIKAASGKQCHVIKLHDYLFSEF